MSVIGNTKLKQKQSSMRQKSFNSANDTTHSLNWLRNFMNYTDNEIEWQSNAEA